jgi:hypothetical protein
LFEATLAKFYNEERVIGRKDEGKNGRLEEWKKGSSEEWEVQKERRQAGRKE